MAAVVSEDKVFLDDIKFRNAVKRVPGIGLVAGKNAYNRFAVHVDAVRGRDDDAKNCFIVKYHGGNSMSDKSAIDNYKNQLNVERKLVMAGFELVEVEHFGWDGWQNVFAWRKAV